MSLVTRHLSRFGACSVFQVMRKISPTPVQMAVSATLKAGKSMTPAAALLQIKIEEIHNRVAAGQQAVGEVAGDAAKNQAEGNLAGESVRN